MIRSDTFFSPLGALCANFIAFSIGSYSSPATARFQEKADTKTEAATRNNLEFIEGGKAPMKEQSARGNSSGFGGTVKNPRGKRRRPSPALLNGPGVPEQSQGALTSYED